VLQGVAGCCRTLQDGAGCCRVLQCIAECCRVLQGDIYDMLEWEHAAFEVRVV